MNEEQLKGMPGGDFKQYDNQKPEAETAERPELKEIKGDPKKKAAHNKKAVEDDAEEEELLFTPVSGDEEAIIEKENKEIGDEEDARIILELLNDGEEEIFSKKYRDELAEMAKEDPTSVMIETPEGWMTIAQALRDGFNPETEEFDQGTVEDRLDKIIAEEGLDPEEAERIKNMILRGQGQEQAPMPMEGAEEMPEGMPMPEGAVPEGTLPVDEAMPAEGQMPAEGMMPAEGQAPSQQIDPALLAAMGG